VNPGNRPRWSNLLHQFNQLFSQHQTGRSIIGFLFTSLQSSILYQFAAGLDPVDLGYCSIIKEGELSFQVIFVMLFSFVRIAFLSKQ